MIEKFISSLRLVAPCLLLLSMLGGFGSCSKSKLPRLKIELSPIDSADTTLYLIYEGLDSVWVDSLPLEQAGFLELQPDTTRLRSLMLSHGAYTRVHRYELSSGVWQPAPMPSPTSAPDSIDTLALLQLSGVDARGKYQSIHDLRHRGAVALIFSSADLSTHSRTERDSLLRQYPKDSLHLVYMMLTPTDSAALSRLKRDSLERKAIVYSDSLFLVSRMRASVGLERTHLGKIFIIDTLGRVRPYLPKP